MSADQNPLDVEAIRARLDAATFTAEITFDNRGGDGEFFKHAPADIRSILDENARLNAELSDFREMAVLNTKSLSRALDEARAELDKVIREAAADKARLDAIDALHVPRPRLAPVTTEHPGHCENCGETWPCSTKRVRDAAPEMPRPPAEEAQDGPKPFGTGSGRGTGVAETPGTAQAGDAWREFSRVIDEEEPDDILAAALDIPGLWADENQPEAPAEAEHVTAVRSTYRPGYASVLLRLIADAETTTPYYRRPVIVQDGAITDAGFLRDAVAAVWGAVPHLLPSLPVPSTEEARDA